LTPDSRAGYDSIGFQGVTSVDISALPQFPFGHSRQIRTDRNNTGSNRWLRIGGELTFIIALFLVMHEVRVLAMRSAQTNPDSIFYTPPSILGKWIPAFGYCSRKLEFGEDDVVISWFDQPCLKGTWLFEDGLLLLRMNTDTGTIQWLVDFELKHDRLIINHQTLNGLLMDNAQFRWPGQPPMELHYRRFDPRIDE
jgi:hypothetical protein